MAPRRLRVLVLLGLEIMKTIIKVWINIPKCIIRGVSIINGKFRTEHTHLEQLWILIKSNLSISYWNGENCKYTACQAMT